MIFNTYCTTLYGFGTPYSLSSSKRVEQIFVGLVCQKAHFVIRQYIYFKRFLIGYFKDVDGKYSQMQPFVRKTTSPFARFSQTHKYFKEMQVNLCLRINMHAPL